MPTVYDGITYYAYSSTPLEANGSDDRLFSFSVDILAVGGGPIVLRSPATGDVISSTLTSSAINGLLPSFLAPALTVVAFGGVVEQALSSGDVNDLAQDAAVAKAEAAASRLAAEAALAQVQALVAGGGTGGGVSSHGALSGLTADDHLQYARADGTRGLFASPGHLHAGVYATSQDLVATSASDRNRANHQGTQAMSTIEGLAAALAAKQDVISITTTVAQAEAAPPGAIVVFNP